MTANSLQFSDSTYVGMVSPESPPAHSLGQVNLAAELSWCQRAYRSSLTLLIIITFMTTLSVAAVVSVGA